MFEEMIFTMSIQKSMTVKNQSNIKQVYMKKLLFSGTLFLLAFFTKAQNVAVNNDGTAAATSAMLDIKSTTKGMLMPRVTTAQRTAIASPVIGLLVFDTDTKTVWAYDGASWKNLYTSGGLALPFTQSVNTPGAAFNVTNTATAIQGVATNVSAAGVVGANNNTGGMGVIGSSTSATGIGVSGQSQGTGVFGNSVDGVGVKASSTNGTALQVNGNVRISGGNTNPSNGAVLTSDASGNAVWQNNKVAFSVSGVNNAINVFPHGVATTVHLKNEAYDYGNNYNAYSGSTPSFGHSTFVAPYTGVYHFDAQMRLSPTGGSTVDVEFVTMTIKIIRSGVGVFYEGTTEFNGGVRGAPWLASALISRDVRLQAGDIVSLEVINDSPYDYVMGSSGVTVFPQEFFNCHLVFQE